MTIFSLQFSTSQIGFRDRIMLRSRENGDLWFASFLSIRWKVSSAKE
jgi:hypothetical protein